MPKMVGAGGQLRQACLSFYAYRDPEDFIELLKNMNNFAYHKGISELCFLCDKEQIQKNLKGFIWINAGSRLYYKKLNDKYEGLGEEIWINGTDI